MKKLSVLLASILSVLSAIDGGTIINSYRFAAAGGAGNEQFSDNFDRGNSGNLGANWTVATGSFALDNTRAEPSTLGFVENVVVYVSPTDTANQYCKFTISTVGSNTYPGLTFRYTNSSSPQYVVYFWAAENKIEWGRKASAADGSFVTVDSTGGSGTATVDAGNIFGVTLTGTGTSTVVRIWRTPPSNTPSSATDWGGDTSPDYTFTADPASAVDTGTGVGMTAELQTSGSLEMDDWFGGDIP